MKKNSSVKYILLICFSFVASACSQSNQELIAEHYKKLSAVPYTADAVFVCHGFSCRDQTPVSRKMIVDIFRENANEAVDPASERKMIGDAISMIEDRVGKLAGTHADKGGFTPPELVGHTSQQDCIDESTNATSYLLVAEKAKLLKYHSVRAPTGRGFFLDGRWPHETAIIKEKSGEALWAVDSWAKDNGGPPQIVDYEEWLWSW